MNSQNIIQRKILPILDPTDVGLTICETKDSDAIYERKEKPVNNRAFRILRTLIVILALMTAVIPASAAAQENVLRVGPGQEYETIQAAVNAAGQGSRILVYPGDYSERVFVNKNNLQILAQGEGVVIEAPDLPAAFLVHADRVTIQGFRIGFGRGCAVGIYFEGSYNTFADNYFYGAASCRGINALVTEDPNGGSDYNIIERNVIDSPDLGIIIVTDALFAVNKGNIIRDNKLIGVGQTPIGITNGIGYVISGNVVSQAPFGTCILVLTGEGNRIPQGHHTIANNKVGSCSNHGISLYAAPGTILTHNRIVDNTILSSNGDGLGLEADIGATLSNNEVSSNRISGSTNASGILLAAEETADVSDNLIQGNLTFNNFASGIYLTSVVEHNRILNNEVHSNHLGIYVAGDENLMVGNWAHENSLDLGDTGMDNLWRNNTYVTSNW